MHGVARSNWKVRYVLVVGQATVHTTCLEQFVFQPTLNLKSALGISSRSLVHRWTVAGGADQIPGYARILKVCPGLLNTSSTVAG